MPPRQVISRYNFNIISNKNKEKSAEEVHLSVAKALHGYQTLPNVTRVKLSISDLRPDGF